MSDAEEDTTFPYEEEDDNESGNEEDDADDGEDFDDYDEDEEEEGPRRKRPRISGMNLVDMEAEAADDEEEDDDEDGAEDGWVAAAAEADVEMSHAEHRRHAARSMMDDGDEDAEAIVARLNERYANYANDAAVMDGEYGGSLDDLRRKEFLPQVQGTKLWMVKCKVGKERDVTLSLMMKFVAKATTNTPLMIKSAICTDNLKGFVYVEADKESHVRDACAGIRMLYNKFTLVPIDEMADVLTVRTESRSLQPGTWVRIKRGVYQDDVGQVYEMDENGQNVRVKLLPRLDMEKIRSGDTTKDKKRKRTALRPAQRLFTYDDALAINNFVQRRGAEYLFHNEAFIDGYILKNLKINNLEYEDVTPSLDELQQFQNVAAGGSSAQSGLKLTGVRRGTTYSKGDVVRVCEGDLINLMGTVVSVDDEGVTIQPDHEDLHDALTFPPEHLTKFFRIGDHIKVMNGKYTGETGMIVKVDDDVVYVYTDLASKEIKVFTHDIQRATEVATGLDAIGEYELYDLVEIDAHTMGVIVKVERDSFRLLDTSETLVNVTLQTIGPKKDSARARGLDHYENSVAVNDVVSVLQGPHKGRTGTVLHVCRSILFLKSREHQVNAGVFAVRARSCQLMGGQKTKKQSDQNARGKGGMTMSTRQRNELRKNYLHKTVKIKKGPHKGLAGNVCDVTDTLVRVELAGKPRKISIAFSDVIVLDGRNNNSSFGGPSRGPASFAGASTPMHYGAGAQTPMYGGETPGRTPQRPETPGWTGDATWAPAETPNTPGTAPSPYTYGATPYDAYTPNAHTPGSALTPGTPGAPSDYYTPGTPGFAPTPNTPGSAQTPGSSWDQH